MARVDLLIRLLARVALLAIPAGLASSACAQSAATAEFETEANLNPTVTRPNVVFIMADDKHEGYREGIRNCVRIDGNRPITGDSRSIAIASN